MRIFDNPKVILVARPSLIPEGVGEVLREYGESPIRGWDRDRLDTDGDGLAELMGRLCYGSFGKRQGRVGAVSYFGNVLESGHGSVLEHATWSFVVCRATRGYTHQQVRHRAGWAYSQESQHFIKYGADDEDPTAQEAGLCLTGWPESIKPGVTAFITYALQFYTATWRLVSALQVPGIKGLKKLVSGLVRGLLPNILESRIGVTANARALRHFCELRGQPDNVLEIRLIACQIVNIMQREAPAMFQDMTVETADDGYDFVVSRWRKV